MAQVYTGEQSVYTAMLSKGAIIVEVWYIIVERRKVNFFQIASQTSNLKDQAKPYDLWEIFSGLGEQKGEWQLSFLISILPKREGHTENILQGSSKLPASGESLVR